MEKRGIEIWMSLPHRNNVDEEIIIKVIRGNEIEFGKIIYLLLFQPNLDDSFDHVNNPTHTHIFP